MKPMTLGQALDSVGKGWAPLIEQLYAAKPEGVGVVQVKEKFGTLRFYTDQVGPPDYEDMINECEVASARICEWCGGAGTLDNSGYWMLTLCEDCKQKRALKKVGSG